MTAVTRAAILAASAVAAAGCASAPRRAHDDQVPLGAPPPKLTDLCERAIVAHGGECPTELPRPSGVERSEVQSLAPPGYAGYFLSANVVGMHTDDAGHVIVGSQPHRFALRRDGGVEGADAALRLPPRSRATVLRRVDVGDGGLALRAAPYPAGGIHGGHVIVLWNAGGHGQLVSLHLADHRHPGRFPLDARVRAALEIARSERPPNAP